MRQKEKIMLFLKSCAEYMYVYSVQDDGEDESECELAEELLFNNYSSETNGIDMQSTHNIQYIKHGDNGYGFDF